MQTPWTTQVEDYSGDLKMKKEKKTDEKVC